MSKSEKKLALFFDKLAHFLIKFHLYFYFVISILIIVFFISKIYSLFNILFIVMIIIYLLELLLGLDRNFIGISGIIILGLIGYMIMHNKNGIFLGITFGILIINILKLILNLIINRIGGKRK